MSDINFWDAHTLLFIIGLIVCPRVVLLYFGMIAQGAVLPIAGIFLVPRITLALLITPIYWESNPAVIIFCWIFAVVFDIIIIVQQLKMGKVMMSMYKESMKALREAQEAHRKLYGY
jgi:uncharacterized radical SAM superfamily protein